MKKKLLAIVMCVGMLLCFVACGYNTGVGDYIESITKSEVKEGELPMGTYVVGEDISVGKYNLFYKTELTEDDYWSNDYFYILRNGSEGTNETWGGQKFDERFGGFHYKAAIETEKAYANLKKGDIITVEASFGKWTYSTTDGGVEKINEVGMEILAGTYLVGDDLDAGKYFITYVADTTEDDYWSNDYFYILRNGSEGTNETWGGQKFDERFGGFSYNTIGEGKKCYVNLKDGDRIVVETSYGKWVY